MSISLDSIGHGKERPANLTLKSIANTKYNELIVDLSDITLFLSTGLKIL